MNYRQNLAVDIVREKLTANSTLKCYALLQINIQIKINNYKQISTY